MVVRSCASVICSTSVEALPHPLGYVASTVIGAAPIYSFFFGDFMASIVLRHLVKRYDNGFEAVRGIDLQIHDGEFMVLVGPSGCGKTTTLRMIAGLEDISGGDIEIGPRRVNDVDPKDRDLAMVFQGYALYPHMTVRQNMEFALRLRKLPADEINRRVLEASRMLSLTTQLDKVPKQLSGGQRQRVALGRAVVRNPLAFLFDEPLSNLDAKLRGEMRYELRALHARLKSTSVYVTHDQIEAMTLGDRITVMNHGEIQQVAEPMVVYNWPWNRFVANFIGTPAMNFFSGTLLTGLTGPVFRSGNIELDLRMPHRAKIAAMNGARVVLGARPEHLTPAPSADMPRFTAKVEQLEMMGDHQYVSLNVPGVDQRVLMKADVSHHFSPGAVVVIGVDTARCHCFAGDGATAVAIDGAENLTLPPAFARQQ